MATSYDAYSGNEGSKVRLYVVATEGTTDVANNRSKVTYTAYMKEMTQNNIYNGSSTSGWVKVNGTTHNGSVSSYDFRPGGLSTHYMFSSVDHGWITHNTDGSKTVSIDGYHNADNSPYLTTASLVAFNLTLTNFPEPASGSHASSSIKSTTATISAAVSTHGNGSSTTLTFYKRKVGAGSWDNEGTGTSKSLTGLTANTDYEWYVKATNNTGNTSNSATQTFTTDPSAGFFALLQ